MNFSKALITAASIAITFIPKAALANKAFSDYSVSEQVEISRNLTEHLCNLHQFDATDRLFCANTVAEGLERDMPLHVIRQSVNYQAASAAQRERSNQIMNSILNR